MNRERILSYLFEHQGKWISGQELGNLFGITRNSISKHIKYLRQQGYEIDAVTKRGYRLVSAGDRLRADFIKENTATKWLGNDKLVILEEVDSTNEYMKRLKADEKSNGLVVVSEKQLNGRGRKGRIWYSPFGEGIYMSVMLKPELSPELAKRFTYAAAVAVCRTLADMGLLRVQFKWPNEAYVNDSKIAGILTEVMSNPDQIDYLVCGIGLNVNQQKFSTDPNQDITSLLMQTGSKKDRNEILANLMKNLETYFDYVNNGKFHEIHREMLSFNLATYNHVIINHANETFEGIARGIDEDGGLIVRLDNCELKTFTTGEITNF
jgi:BirA family biotin operon repressor/biotin-[acetyl-CoA-carboxylase] ligase